MKEDKKEKQKEDKGIKITQILLDGNYIDPDVARRAMEAETTGHMSAEDFLISEDIVTKDLVGQAMAEHYKVDYLDLNSKQPNKETVLKLPFEIAKKFHVVLISEQKGTAIIATDDPSNTQLKDALLDSLDSKKIDIQYSISEDIDQVLLYYRKPLYERINLIAESEESAAPKIVEELLLDAVMLRASDIHLEPQKSKVLVRFRIDGVLKPMVKLSKGQYESVLNRLKVMAHLRTDQHQKTQDGSI